MSSSYKTVDRWMMGLFGQLHPHKRLLCSVKRWNLANDDGHNWVCRHPHTWQSTRREANRSSPAPGTVSIPLDAIRCMWSPTSIVFAGFSSVSQWLNRIIFHSKCSSLCRNGNRRLFIEPSHRSIYGPQIGLNFPRFPLIFLNFLQFPSISLDFPRFPLISSIRETMEIWRSPSFSKEKIKIIQIFIRISASNWFLELFVFDSFL